MPQSLANILVHIIFSTKDRYPFIADAVRLGLHGYMAGVLKELNSPALVINSMPDHAHVLCSLSKNLAVCKMAEEVKKGSSKWIKANGVPSFGWQNGDGAFSVSQSNAARVRNYIVKQQEHHRKVSYQDQFRRFLEKYQISYDERYVWN